MSVNHNTKKRPSAGQEENLLPKEQRVGGDLRSQPLGAGSSPLPAAVRGFRIIEVLEKAGQIKEIKSAVHPCNAVRRAENAIGTSCFSSSIADQHVLGLRPLRQIQIFEC